MTFQICHQGHHRFHSHLLSWFKDVNYASDFWKCSQSHICKQIVISGKSYNHHPPPFLDGWYQLSGIICLSPALGWNAFLGIFAASESWLMRSRFRQFPKWAVHSRPICHWVEAGEGCCHQGETHIFTLNFSNQRVKINATRKTIQSYDTKGSVYK